ncbi:MAG: hormogonium polysaccharide secretion pseudopilin HpsB [Cyanobacteria bacterium P01_A01_bin.45]
MKTKYTIEAENSTQNISLNMSFFFQKLLLKRSKTNSEESGFTIIESLIAIIVVAILMTAIAPAIVLSTATRVQARRVEMATQAARSFIDGLRTGKVDSSNIQDININASESRKISSNSLDYLITANQMQLPRNTSGLYCFNKDSTFENPGSGCTSDLFYIQAARIRVTGSDPEDGYRLAIRIYREDTEFNRIQDPNDREKQSTFTGGLGSRRKPLMEITTEIANDDTSFDALCQRLGSASGSCD